MHSVNHILEDLRENGIRLTKARKALVSLFCKTKKPLSADQIADHLSRTQATRIHKVTIYRELEFLSHKKIITPVLLGDRSTRYELSFHDHHHHVVCKKCHRIEDVVLRGNLESEIRHVQKKTRFRVISHSLEFFGLCKSCINM